ncbi:MAG TPA: discoidin domain-containing protein [Bryobacteraceae bacterium]|nr:discoidin domain-containing protein [Bryobacteraceae bacterium]
MIRLVVAVLMTSLSLGAQQYSLGVGVYPGNPAENFAPLMRVDQSYRNLALRRAAYASSSYDYNLTAQLVTDGIKSSALPRWVSTATSEQGKLPKEDRERFLDGDWVTGVDLRGPSGWVELELGGGDRPPEVDRIGIEARVRAAAEQPESWTCTISGSLDGRTWKELGRAAGMAHLGGDIRTSVSLNAPSRSRFYRVTFEDPRARTWSVGEVKLFDRDEPVHAGGPYNFTSAWRSAGTGHEWVYVDLGAICSFDRLMLYWIRRPAEGSIDVSDDATVWRTIEALPSAGGSNSEIKLPRAVRARYVRVSMTRAESEDGYILSEMEVYGRGGPRPHPKTAPAIRSDGRLDLAGGAWRVERASEVEADGKAISTPGFRDGNWLVATVPGTVLTSYLNAGAIPDPNYADNQLMISDSFFYSDFWYRDEFVAPRAVGGRFWLNFDGINWKADVFLNGHEVGRIDGAFTRGKFDVTGLVRAGERNAIAVRIEKNATPGSVKEKTFQRPDTNGGALGADNPTFQASGGWDWIPTIRGREAGIWNDVYLTSSGPVTLEDPFVRTALPLPDTTHADVTIQVSLRNHESQPVNGILRGRFGGARFEAPITLPAGAAATVTLDPSTQPSLRLQNPKLWWPAGYGKANLYNVELQFVTENRTVSDETSFAAGVRQFTYTEQDGTLRIWINGRRFVPRGGNWGFSESMLRYRQREYDIAVHYHRDMNFNMIRNWVGQTADDAFYRACDRYGIVVWQDFWLANPWDGPDPADDSMFLRNARDLVLRIRNHASVDLYCGRNEGYPPEVLDAGIRTMLAELDPGAHYIPNSADGVVSGHGPYHAMPAKYYFEQRATTKLHSEMGMPNIVTMDSLRLMMPESAMWPQGRMWGLHDFTLAGAQDGAAYRQRIEDSYGTAGSAAEWLWLAQFENYEGYRAMFEAQSRNRMGLLIWMSHPAWPSFVWQTYDYYFDPTAAYFGCKKASEPLHIQWNPVSDKVEVVNYSAGNQRGMTARVQILNLDGAVKWQASMMLDSADDSTMPCIQIEYPVDLTPVHFLRLELTRGNAIISENFYWRGLKEGDYRALRELPMVALESSTTVQRHGGHWMLTTELSNPSKFPALMVRLKVVREKSGDRILPAFYSDNYVALMPGKHRTLTTEVENADTRGERPRIEVEGFNVQQSSGGQVSTTIR